ncbi:unnamed protein product [Prunus armeniaca]
MEVMARGRPRVILACERNGNYKSCKSSETTDIRSDANSDMKKCARDTGTKKCGCPFLLKGVNIGDGDDWKLEVVCGVHNHLISEYLQGHSFVGRLTEEENALLVHLSPDHPIPLVSRMWHEQSDICNVTHLYSRYQARVDAFQQLPGVENVATIDTVILMTDENAPVTELRL